MKSNEIEISRYDRENEESLQEAACWEDVHVDVLKMIKEGSRISSYTGKVAGELMGIATSWKNYFHPYCHYIAMKLSHDCDPSVANALLGQLESVLSSDIPMQTSIWESNLRLKLIYEQNGFYEMRKTFMPTLPLRNHRIGCNTTVPNGYILLTLQEVSEDICLKEKLIKLVKHTYEETHLANPVASLSLSRWEGLVFQNDLIKEGSYVLIKEGEPMVYSFLHHGEERIDTCELGWCGAVNHEHMEHLRLIVSLQLLFSKEYGFTFLQAEADTTDPFAMHILASFPFEHGAALLTFQKQCLDHGKQTSFDVK
ncbi:hypothetical protein [Falsibacillus albus]|uniref:Uncharacterized protein n=1 Tax=Falsibacillus albus TaxID=2478915 RepID=A0A3L7JUJ3_9BACI|nr:hypothetical protein [Falsibacillus albus]RLQ93301.1 hypothetical protein D9X91_17715 [Falsibacillus albus]